jgi:hypothetical protein
MGEPFIRRADRRGAKPEGLEVGLDLCRVMLSDPLDEPFLVVRRIEVLENAVSR